MGFIVYDKTLDPVISPRLRVASNKCPRAPLRPAPCTLAVDNVTI